MGKLAISEMVLFDEPSNKQRATGGVANVFRWTMSRPRVNESSERNFIKVILTKDQGRSKRNKK